ncbi:MAG: hypothetical protein K2Z25_06960 [Beijerinckiaceae bacterium]|nr:hypothetical protein [Beijerinckiaceae bacterium]
MIDQDKKPRHRRTAPADGLANRAMNASARLRLETLTQSAAEQIDAEA